MKRFLGSLFLIVCLLAGLMQPVFATESTEEAVEPLDNSIQTTEEPDLEENISDQPISAGEFLDEPPVESIGTASQTQETSETVRSGNLTVSAEGISFINEMMGGSYGGTQQLASAEAAVNAFRSSYGITLTQTQFDALADFVMAYGSTILTSGYKVEKVIGSGSYTELELANAFCSWVKSGNEFSQQRLNRRLREIKLFLYGSYSGDCYVSFRYIVFQANGGTLDDNTVLCYALNGTYSALPTASRSGKYFAGWYTAASGGTQVCNSSTVSQNYTLYAHWSDSPVSNPNDGNGSSGDDGDEEVLIPPTLKVSESCVQFIKDNEGFAKYPMWDYGQYSVGYGTRCPPEKYEEYCEYGITVEEADYLLRVMLSDMEKTVDKILQKATVTHSRNQYDAILSFTYNLGTQWVNENYNIYRYFLYGGYTEMQFVNAIGSWCRAGGSVLGGLVRRRMDEANMYLNGDYTVGSRNYLCIEFHGATGEPEYPFYYYKTGTALGKLPTASLEGHRLVGWYDKLTGGTQYTTETIAPSRGKITLYAHWEVGTDTLPDPTPTPEPVPTPSIDFTDVPIDAWFYPYVMQAVDFGLFSGVSSTQFSPNGTMTRAMVVTVLHRMVGSPEASGELPFTDVAEGLWYSEAVRWAYSNKIVNGVSDTVFGVNSNVTREQLAVMLYRFADYLGRDITAQADLSSFTDAGTVSSYAVRPMSWAVACDILGGSDGRLNPTGFATRAQCAKMMTVFAVLFEVIPTG